MVQYQLSELELRERQATWCSQIEKLTKHDRYLKQLCETIAEKYDYKELMTEKELEEKAEDDLFFDEDDFMKDYRAKKLAELKEDQAKPHFNGVLEINK